MMTTRGNTTLYVGVTADILSRTIEHRQKVDPNSFTARYNINKLVWMEHFSSIEEAIDREKQIKRWSRKKKEFLINQQNPAWKDLFDEIKDW